MTRGLAALGSAVFFLIAPTTVAGVVPWWISRWRLQAPFFDLQFIRWFGVVLILLGIPVLVETFTRFVLQGGGTPAPVAPAQHLVITGPNRYVRNPIYLRFGASGEYAAIPILVYRMVEQQLNPAALWLSSAPGDV